MRVKDLGDAPQLCPRPAQSRAFQKKEILGNRNRGQNSYDRHRHQELDEGKARPACPLDAWVSADSSMPDGKLTLNSDCIAGTVNINGTFDFVNSGSGQTVNDDGHIGGLEAEPTGAPAATGTMKSKIARLHQALRNKLTMTAGAKTFFNDSDAALWSKATSDDGTTYTESEGS